MVSGVKVQLRTAPRELIILTLSRAAKKLPVLFLSEDPEDDNSETARYRREHEEESEASEKQVSRQGVHPPIPIPHIVPVEEVAFLPLGSYA
jgi:hypothetical protein